MHTFRLSGRVIRGCVKCSGGGLCIACQGQSKIDQASKKTRSRVVTNFSGVDQHKLKHHKRD
jgi:hypothetical protein